MSDSPSDRARDLRQCQTLAEHKLWQAIRGGRLEGLKFRRQHPIDRFYADFACEKLRLVIELDGGVHDQDEQHLRDHLRQQEIENLGWFVMRFSNDDVLHRLHEVLDSVGLRPDWPAA